MPEAGFRLPETNPPEFVIKSAEPIGPGLLARILASADFDASERNRRVLSHIVEETLAGRGDRIKAYGIALTVFDHDDSFDPKSDPIVRIEASRLRRSLERYYPLAGKDDPLRIEIPKGGYVPVFRLEPEGGREGAAGLPEATLGMRAHEAPACETSRAHLRESALRSPGVLRPRRRLRWRVCSACS